MTSSTPRPLGPYSPIVRAGDFLIVSGQTGTKAGALVSGGLEAQVRAAMGNLDTLLTLHGSRLRDVVKTTVFLTDMADFAAMNTIYAEIFGETRPLLATDTSGGDDRRHGSCRIDADQRNIAEAADEWEIHRIARTERHFLRVRCHVVAPAHGARVTREAHIDVMVAGNHAHQVWGPERA